VPEVFWHPFFYLCKTAPHIVILHVKYIIGFMVYFGELPTLLRSVKNHPARKPLQDGLTKTFQPIIL